VIVRRLGRSLYVLPDLEAVARAAGARGRTETATGPLARLLSGHDPGLGSPNTSAPGPVDASGTRHRRAGWFRSQTDPGTDPPRRVGWQLDEAQRLRHRRPLPSVPARWLRPRAARKILSDRSCSARLLRSRLVPGNSARAATSAAARSRAGQSIGAGTGQSTIVHGQFSGLSGFPTVTAYPHPGSEWYSRPCSHDGQRSLIGRPVRPPPLRQAAPGSRRRSGRSRPVRPW
jgi:hypothetical protein